MKFPLLCIGTILFALGQASADSNATWPRFRGVNGSGISERGRPPIRIGPNERAAWRIDLPWSPSSPCIWEGHLFITTYIEGELQTRAYDRANGELLWSHSVKPETFERYHKHYGSPAASTPATNGKVVVSYFGSWGVACFDFQGKELWRRQLPVAASGGSYGSGTSPIIAGDLVVLNRDQDLGSSLLALKLDSGQTAWETSRPDAAGSFGTPLIWTNHGVQEIVMPGTVRLKGYELATGKEVWMYEGVSVTSVSSPILADGLVFFAEWAPGKGDAPWPTWEGFRNGNDKNKDDAVSFDELPEGSRENARGLDADHDDKVTKKDFDILFARVAKAQNVLVAIKPGGSGDISESHAAWKHIRGLPYVASPIVYLERIYFVRDGGMVSSLDTKTGTPSYLQERIDAPGSYYSSPVAAAGRIYFASLDGRLTVIKAGGDKPEILHQADFGERIAATPAIVDHYFYLRTESKLFAFGDGKPDLK